MLMPIKIKSYLNLNMKLKSIDKKTRTWVEESIEWIPCNHSATDETVDRKEFLRWGGRLFLFLFS